ncbi:acylneuraminate cytidylyltransferase family protein [Flavobacteriaceae bacterium D16]|nr:acylneuraminate cytidylyltransferase family protein [Flavobacteriaceae bacterium D16]
MNAFAVIPARGGSKGVPGKNIKPLNGKPLIQYTIDAARKLLRDCDIVVSSDDPEIIGIVQNLGLQVPFVRPSYLATDYSSMQEVLLHALDYYEKEIGKADILILLQPTSPFRDEHQIQKALELYKTKDEIDMVVSVKATKANPYFVLFEEGKEGYLEKSKSSNFVTRQEAPEVWQYNGAIYVINTRSLREKKMSQFNKVVKFVMDDLASLDIDTTIDWIFAEFILSKGLVQAKK